MNTGNSNLPRKQNTPFAEGTLLMLKNTGKALPATFQVFQKCFPGNRLDLLTIGEYSALELILKPIIDNPYSVETLVGLRDTVETLLVAKLNSNYDFVERTIEDIAWREESDDDFPVSVDDNTIRFQNREPTSLDELCARRKADGVDRRIESILTPIRTLIMDMRNGESVSPQEIDRIIDPIMEHLGSSMYASRSAIKLRQGGKNEGSHLPIVAADAFYRSEVYTAFSKRMILQMEQLFSQAQKLLRECKMRIWKSDENQDSPVVSMVSSARVERIFRNELLQEEDKLSITALYRDVTSNLNEMRKIMDGYKKSGKGVDQASIEGFLSKNAQFHLCASELNLKLGGTTPVRGIEGSSSLTRLLPFNQ